MENRSWMYKWTSIREYFGTEYHYKTLLDLFHKHLDRFRDVFSKIHSLDKQFRILCGYAIPSKTHTSIVRCVLWHFWFDDTYELHKHENTDHISHNDCGINCAHANLIALCRKWFEKAHNTVLNFPNGVHKRLMQNVLFETMLMLPYDLRLIGCDTARLFCDSDYAHQMSMQIRQRLYMSMMIDHANHRNPVHEKHPYYVDKTGFLVSYASFYRNIESCVRWKQLWVHVFISLRQGKNNAMTRFLRHPLNDRKHLLPLILSFMSSMKFKRK